MEFNVEIINETTLILNHTRYKYVIVSVYDADQGTNLRFNYIKVNNITVRYLLPNRSVTYTGLRPLNYLVQINDKTCKATFWTISYVEASRHVTIHDIKVCKDIYAVTYSLTKKVDNIERTSLVRIILIKTK